MIITYDAEQQIFHLTNNHISYVFGILENGHLGHFHFGQLLHGPLTQATFRRHQNRGLTPYLKEGDFGFSLNLERLEYPVYGTSDFREPALAMTCPSGSQLLDFKVTDYSLSKGKPAIKGLPSTRSHQDEDSMTLSIVLKDDVTKAELSLFYTIFAELPIIARHGELRNTGDQPLQLNQMMSCSLDLMDANWQWLQLSGEWIRERHLHSRALCPGIQSISSRRGASSAQHNPFVILKREHTTEDHGEAIGLSLVYSGNFRISAEVDSSQITRLTAGIHPDGFSWELKPQETFESPEALLSYSTTGLGPLSQSFHALFNHHLIPPQFQRTPRPVLINSWEAAYFDFDEERLLSLASEAAHLGIDLFVLDDGWFGDRSDDTCGLGDWTINYAKLPSGLIGLSEKIKAFGLQFGLWIEPEMINKGTPLYHAHPEWIIADPSHPPCHARNQYILDYSNPEVVDHIYDQLTAVLDDVHLSYLKWDMNRNMTDLYSQSLPPDRQNELAHRYILGVYSLYDKLTKRYPNLLIESCSAGGGRFDPGMLYYAPQAWTSDNTDAVCRLKIQYGTSFAYPLSAMGSHVSASPNHQVGRTTSLAMRSDVALFGSFGYELDLTRLSSVEKETIKQQIQFFKTHQDLIHHGDFYRLLNPFEDAGNEAAWMVVRPDKTKALVGWYQILAQPNQGLGRLKLQGLETKALYQINNNKDMLSGSTLMNFGLMIQPSFNGIHRTEDATGDYQSRVFVLTLIPHHISSKY
jgi:alpha-galactosidase